MQNVRHVGDGHILFDNPGKLGDDIMWGPAQIAAFNMQHLKLYRESGLPETSIGLLDYCKREHLEDFTYTYIFNRALT